MRILLLFAFLLIGMSSYSQNLLRQDLYYQNMNYINAAVGLTDTTMKNDIQVYGIHKIVPQNGWNYIPQMMVNYIGRLNKMKSTVNVGYSLDDHSYFNRQVMHVGFASQFKKGNHHFDLGARINFNFDYVKDRSVLQSAEVPTVNKLYFLPDLDLGFQYRIKGWTLGVSAKNLFKSRTGKGYELFANERVFYANFGYAKQFGSVFKLGVFTLPSYTTTFNIDLGVDFSFWNRLNTTYIFRLKELRHIYSIRGSITKNIYMGVSCGNSHVSSDMNLNALVGVRF